MKEVVTDMGWNPEGTTEIFRVSLKKELDQEMCIVVEMETRS